MSDFFANNGYLTVFLTVVISGELGLFVGVALAHAGSVTMAGVIAVGTLAAFLGNTVYYCAGAFAWEKWAFLRNRYQQRVEATAKNVQRFGLPVMVVARFLYGVRNIVPLVLGIYRVDFLRFALYNGAGCIVWVLAFTELGYLVAPAVARIF